MVKTKFQADSTNTSKFDLTFTSVINFLQSVAIRADTLVFRMKTGAIIKQDLHNTLFEKLENFRKQGKNISDLNPILSLADDICEQIYQKKITHEDIELLIKKMGSQLWDNQIRELRVKTGTETNVETLLSATDLASVDVSKTIYQAVFTAHPVFSLNAKNSCKYLKWLGAVSLNHFLIMPMTHALKYLFKMSMTKRLQPLKAREKQSCRSTRKF